MYQSLIPFLLPGSIPPPGCNRIGLCFPVDGFTQGFNHLSDNYLSIETLEVIKSAQVGGKETPNYKVTNKEISVRLFILDIFKLVDICVLSHWDLKIVCNYWHAFWLKEG